MSRDSRLQDLSDRVGELVDSRVEAWEDHASLLRSIMEGRTGDGEVANHLVELTLPYYNVTVGAILGQGEEE